MIDIKEVVQHSGKKKVVVIDDEVVTRKVVSKALEDDFDVYIVTNIFESIRICEVQMPDVILLDLLMPSVDGFEILELLKNHAVLCDIPVVCMSSSEDSSDRKRIRNLGAIGFIKKPISVKTLADDINQVLESVTNVISSVKNHVEFITTFNSLEKDKYILKILTNIAEDEKVIFLSWDKGDYFYEENELIKKYIDDERLIFLETKPSLITKFSYMQDLSPLLDDITRFTGRRSRDITLVIDEIRNLINDQNSDRGVSQAYKLSQNLHNNFKNVTYLNSRPRKNDEQLFLNKIGKILVGNRL
ncbi:PleD family two-component system response regulator [Halobacteriovorax sp.]|uniref:response regulator n=1 Tax=Halobacteriovorax sp. TaxID=2020862 RepID=UPI003564C002